MNPRATRSIRAGSPGDESPGSAFPLPSSASAARAQRLSSAARAPGGQKTIRTRSPAALAPGGQKTIRTRSPAALAPGGQSTVSIPPGSGSLEAPPLSASRTSPPLQAAVGLSAAKSALPSETCCGGEFPPALPDTSLPPDSGPTGGGCPQAARRQQGGAPKLPLRALPSRRSKGVRAPQRSRCSMRSSSRGGSRQKCKERMRCQVVRPSPVTTGEGPGVRAPSDQDVRCDPAAEAGRVRSARKGCAVRWCAPRP